MYSKFNANFNKKRGINHMNEQVSKLESKLAVSCNCPTKRFANGKNIKNCVCGDGIIDSIKNAYSKTFLGKKLMPSSQPPQQPPQASPYENQQ